MSAELVTFTIIVILAIAETAPDQWVDDEPQSWTTGNFETKEAANKWGFIAYRYINKARSVGA